MASLGVELFGERGLKEVIRDMNESVFVRGQMKPADATAEVFLTAFEALPKAERETVLQRLFADPAVKEDLIDVARWYERRAERAMPYRTFRQRLKKAGDL